MNPSMSFEKFWQVFNSLSGPRKLTLLGVTILTMASIMMFVYFTNQEDYRVLFSNLASEDASSIVTKLKEKKIPYQISPAGDTISVPSGKVSELRLELAAAGLPHGGGVGFEIFDNKTLGATEFDQQLNYRRALQGELVRTINSLEEIQQCRVHIALPRESLFIDQQKKATASVAIKLKAGRKLTQSQIEGIGHLVASSIEGLNPDDVMIVDSQGNIMSKGQGDSRLARMSSSQIEYQRNIEKEMGSQIQTLLENVVGQGKAVVRVNADLDFRITEKTEETYDPESPVVRSTQKQSDRMNAALGKASSGSEKEKTDEVVNYEINKTVSKTVMPVGEVKNISIAVLVDGIYTKDAKGTATYQERPKKELESLEELVRKSAGFNSQRGDQVVVTSMPFSRTDLEQGMIGRSWQDQIAPAIPIIKYVIILTGLLFSFLFIIRPLIRNVILAARSSESGHQMHLPAASSSTATAELHGQAGPLSLPQFEEKPMSEVELAKHLAGTNAQKYAELLRNWLK